MLTSPISPADLAAPPLPRLSNSSSSRPWILHRSHGSWINDERDELGLLVTAAQARGLDPRVVDPATVHAVVDSPPRLFLEGQEVSPPSWVINRLGAATDAETLYVLRRLQALGTVVCNPPAATAAATDKFRAHERLVQLGLPTPQSIVFSPGYHRPEDVARLACRLLPASQFTIKRSVGSQGVGVYGRAVPPADLAHLLAFLPPLPTGEPYLVQRYVDTRVAQDIRVLVMGSRVVAAMQRRGAAHAGICANASQGGSAGLIDHDGAIGELALRASRGLGLLMAGVDLLYDEEGFSVLEVNTSPGFTTLATTCGLDVAAEMIDFVCELSDLFPDSSQSIA